MHTNHLMFADMFLLELQNSPVCFSAWTLFNLDMAALRTVSPTCFFASEETADSGCILYRMRQTSRCGLFTDAGYFHGLFPGCSAVCSGRARMCWWARIFRRHQQQHFRCIVCQYYIGPHPPTLSSHRLPE